MVVPLGGVDAVRIDRVDRHVDDAGVRRRAEVGRQDRRPVVAAVDRAVEAALAAGRVDRAGRCDEDNVRVGRVDRDPADHARVLEPDVRPRCAVVGRLVDAVADVGDAAAGGVRLAGAGPERAVGAARERADRLRVVVRPGGRVGRSGVGALPDAAARRGYEIVFGCAVSTTTSVTRPPMLLAPVYSQEPPAVGTSAACAAARCTRLRESFLRPAAGCPPARRAPRPLRTRLPGSRTAATTAGPRRRGRARRRARSAPGQRATPPPCVESSKRCLPAVFLSLASRSPLACACRATLKPGGGKSSQRRERRRRSSPTRRVRPSAS